MLGRRAASLLQIHDGEGRLVTLLVALMFAPSAGIAMGLPSIEALFLARIGPEFLPYMYIALGLVTAAVTLGITPLLARFSRVRFYLALPLLLALLLAGARLLVALDLDWFYGVLWVGGFLMETLQVTLTWGLAGMICNTRQAKRLFPLFGAGAILGTATGGLITGPFVQLLGSENLLLVWATLLLVVLGLVRVLTRDVEEPVSRSRHDTRVIDDLQDGYRFVRRSGLLGWIAIAAVLFSFLFFILAFPFATVVAEQFPDEGTMTGFLGVFKGLTTAVALLISLGLANRFYGRFGLVGGVLSVAVLLLAGFSVLSVYAGFTMIVALRFLQQAWVIGIARTAWQALFNVAPPQRREQARMFVSGVAWQAGIVLVGIVLVIGERALSGRSLFLIGAFAAALATYVMWRAHHAYTGALVDALRAGRPQVFFGEEQSFGGFQKDAAALTVAVNGLSDPDTGLRRVAAEILGDLAVPRATHALVDALDDPDAQVREAVLRSLARTRAAPALLDVAVCLTDPEPAVRLQAITTLRELTDHPRGLEAHAEPLLDDPVPAVRAGAAAALLRVSSHARALAVLRDMAAQDDVESRVQALDGFGVWGAAAAYAPAVEGLADPVPAVRRAAARALAQLGGPRCVAPLVRALGDEDRLVREKVAVAIGVIGSPALRPTLDALSDPQLEAGALLALARLPVQPEAAALRRYVEARTDRALQYHALWERAVAMAGQDDGVRLLVDSLRDVAEYHATHALQAFGFLGDSDAMVLVIDSLHSADPDQQANALEILDSVRDGTDLRPLLRVWERTAPTPEAAGPAGDSWLTEVLRDDDPWLRACAALVAKRTANPQVRDELAHMVQNDPDAIARDTACVAFKGETCMQTLPTLPLMERILFLRRVPLFAGLPPTELKQVAAIAEEFLFTDGEIISHQDDPGDELYIIASGEVRVMADGNGTGQVELARRKSGDYVGEMAIISHEPRMASLVAVGDVRILRISQAQFEGILRERPETSLAVMRGLCARLRECNE